MNYGSFRPAIACAIAAGIFSFSVSSSKATDLYTSHPGYTYKDSPAIVSYPNWAGFYAGGHIGGGWRNGGGNFTVNGGNGGGGGGGGGDNNFGSNPTGEVGVAGNLGGTGGLGGNQGEDPRFIGGNGGQGGQGGEVGGASDNDTALIGGIHLGYNWQYEQFVFGIEGDASFDGGVDDYLASLRARLGIAARDDLFFYLTGGLAFRSDSSSDAIGLASAGGQGGDGGANDDLGDNFPAEVDDLAGGGLGGGGGDPGTPQFAGFGSDDSGNDTGFVVGAGVEYMLTGNVSAGFEGLYYNFDDDDVTVLRGRLTLHLDRSPHDSFKDSILSASVADWSGFYGGGNIGVGFGSGKRVSSVKTDDGEDGGDGDPGAASDSTNAVGGPKADGIDDPGAGGGGGGGGAAALVFLEDDSSILGGVHVGFNWQDDSLVFGIEGDANWADESFRDYLASVRLRIGHAFDRVLVYGTAGVAFTNGSGDVSSVSTEAGSPGIKGNNGGFENQAGFINSNENGPFGASVGGEGGAGGDALVTFSDGDDQIGFVVGGGFEVKLWDRTSIGVEGLYYGFDGNGSSSTGTSFAAGDDLTASIVRGRMTFQLQEERDTLK